MPTDRSSVVKIEIGHVLFIDIVGYSKLLTHEQREQLETLKQVVRGTDQFRRAEAEGKLLRLPTGDGGALVFRNSPEAPVLCASEISKELKKHPELRVRMGIHSGPVSEIADLNEQANIAGAGINVAQRVMDCGDTGHILLSKHVADDLEHYPGWQPYLHSLGDCEVKHGARIGVVNLYNSEIGNSKVPTKLRDTQRSRMRTQWAGIAVGLLLLVGIITAFVIVSKRSAIPIPSSKSIAVLPFVNMSADKNDEYISDGISEELINTLVKVPGLQVPGRTSCFAFKGRNEEGIFHEVGNRLHVGAVLEGSVRKVGDKLRITAQLINVADGYHLWSEDYDGDVKDMLTFQSNVAQRVVEALQGKLGVEAKRVLATRPTENPEAHRLYLLGRYQFAKFTDEGWSSAISYYQQALQADPNFALAYCGIADTYGWMGGYLLPGRDAWAKEKEFAQKALKLDPDLAEAHASLAIALGSEFDWQNSERETDRAVELNPKLAIAYDNYAFLLNAHGHTDQALEQEQKAIDLDPLNPLWRTGFAFHLYSSRQYEEALVRLRRDLAELEANASYYFVSGWCLAAQGKFGEATGAYQKARDLNHLTISDGAVAYAYGRAGDGTKAEEIIAHLTAMASQQYVPPEAFMYAYLGLGEKEKALDWLEKSCEEKDPVAWRLLVDPVFDPLRNEPRFQALLKKVGLG